MYGKEEKMSNVKERIEENLSGLSSLIGHDNVEDVKKTNC